MLQPTPFSVLNVYCTPSLVIYLFVYSDLLIYSILFYFCLNPEHHLLQLFER